jgi:uncharacterized membrane protein YphA (DoxX/SURF4 family)
VSTLLILLPMRIFLAVGWLRAGVEKAIDEHWWSGDGLRTYLDDQHDQALPFMRPIMESAIRPAAVPVAALVVVLEIAIAGAIASGVRLGVALRLAVALNVVFVMTGRVNPSCFYLIMEVALLFALAAGLLGRAPIRVWRPTRWSIAIWLTASIAFTPFIRTLEPKHVIEDPAIMLTFLSLIVAVGLLLARAHTTAQERPRWAVHVFAWSRADTGLRPFAKRVEATPAHRLTNGPQVEET